MTEPISELKASLHSLKAKGCLDPLIKYLFIRQLPNPDNTPAEGAQEHLRAANELWDSKYPPIRKFYAASRALDAVTSAQPKSPELARLLKYEGEALAEALEDREMPLDEADAAIELGIGNSWWAGPTRWELYKAIETPLNNRWPGSHLTLLSKGRAYLAYGWMARGSGYADTVSDKGWKLLAQRLNVASDALEAAWDLNTNDFRVCLELMRVELGQGKGRPRLEMWFKRGMHLQPSNYDLCWAKLEYLRPRWYGTTQEMIAFGRSCTTNTSFEIGARLMVVDAYEQVAGEIPEKDARAKYWRDPKLWADIQGAYEQFFTLYPKETGFRHNYAKSAFRSGQWQVFLDQVRQFPSTNHVYFGGVERFNNMVAFAQRQVR